MPINFEQQLSRGFQKQVLCKSIQLGLLGLALGGSLIGMVQAQSFPADHIIELSELNTPTGVPGLVINGIAANDYSGSSVSNVGDINGDGIDDLIIGARGADVNSNGSGQTYVLFGENTGVVASGGVVELSNLNAASTPAGLVINGIDAFDSSGRSVSNAGDINGDGIEDLMIGANLADPNAKNSGETYVVFGNSTGVIADGGVIELSDLNIPGNPTGLVINGFDANRQSGFSVSNAGDINGDGIDDLLIGAGGGGYVVFGNSTGVVADGGVIELSSLNNADKPAGLVISIGPSETSVSNAGDINGDGIDDLLIGAPFADPNANNSGVTFVLYGNNTGVLANGGEIDLRDLNAPGNPTGLVINGIDEDDLSGRSVSNAGDINGDGIDDLIIGVRYGDPNGNNSGETYVVFGSSSGVVANGGVIELAELNSAGGVAGLVINGVDTNDRSGISVNNAGDINDDDINDLVIGAPSADPNGNNSGTTYVLFGDNDGVLANGGVIELVDLNTLGNPTGLVINGINAYDGSGGSVSNAGDINGDGIDDLIIGAVGGDPNANLSGETYVIFGINDVLFEDSFE